MLAKKYRFRGLHSLKPLFKKAKSLRGDGFQVRYIPSASNRFAVIVSKKVAKSAVVRNRIRRRIFTILEEYAESSPHHDLAIIVYDNNFSSINYLELQNKLTKPLLEIFTDKRQ